ncbi:hypothetical protein [Aquirufa regiilacus]|uniref:O-antigen ligase domain-containing protein n=1 Tax=Aquirufa regiilacus TaxID=3024868 RepID=A0ABU3TQP8_9BACT|nr:MULTISPECIES: hypothetical protein [unclassified Aquirufa]MDT8886843.1 hypothetical protein [Aquirufa sp. LEPPI-3A]MDU0808192.1 hypothetical protein [Aquirufa sp. LEOWEIH-7C]
MVRIQTESQIFFHYNSIFILYENKLFNWKVSLGIILIWIAPPFIYFLKELLGIGQTSLFTGVVYSTALILLINHIPLKIFYRGNEMLAFTGLSFFFLGFFYFIFYNSQKSSIIVDAINFAILIGFIYCIFRVNNDVQYYIPVIILIVTLINNFALIYSISTNPNYVLGARATVQYNKGTGEEFSGNPIVFGRNAVAGLIVSFLIIHKKALEFIGNKSIRINLVAHINILVSFVVLILTQSRGNFISVGLCIIFYLVFGNYSVLKGFQSSKITILYYLIVLGILQYFNRAFKIIETFNRYSDQAYEFLLRALNTGLGINNSGTTQDASALNRVQNIDMIKKIISRDWFDFIFGKGYKFWYVDIPALEAFVNFGILGVLLFCIFNLFILYYIILGVKSNNLFQNFISLFYINLFVAVFTGGRPLDFSYWVFYIILIRFLLILPKNKLASE